MLSGSGRILKIAIWYIPNNDIIMSSMHLPWKQLLCGMRCKGGGGKEYRGKGRGGMEIWGRVCVIGFLTQFPLIDVYQGDN